MWRQSPRNYWGVRKSKAIAVDQHAKANGLLRSAKKLMQVKGMGARTVEISGKTLAGERGVKVQVSNFTVVPDRVVVFLAVVWHIKI